MFPRDYALIGTDVVWHFFLQQTSRPYQGIVPAGTCTVSLIIPKKTNIYLNGLNTAEYKAVVGVG